MEFEPPENVPPPESLRTLRRFHANLRLLAGYDIIVIRNHVDIRRIVDFIRTRPRWNGVVEVETDELTVRVLADTEFEIMDVDYYVVLAPPQEQGGEPQQ